MIGLNLSNNLIEKEDLTYFLNDLQSNRAIHAIIIGDNPGFDSQTALLANTTIVKNESRLHNLPVHAQIQIRKWIDLQIAESKTIENEDDAYGKFFDSDHEQEDEHEPFQPEIGSTNDFFVSYHNPNPKASNYKAIEESNMAIQGNSTIELDDVENIMDSIEIDKDESLEHAIPTPPAQPNQSYHHHDHNHSQMNNEKNR